MKNLSGTGEGWYNKDIVQETTEATETVSNNAVISRGFGRKPIVPEVSEEVQSLIEFQKKLEEKYAATPHKNIYDSMVSVADAILCLKGLQKN